MKCGACGRERETGSVCCVFQAKNQGRLHATCDHPPPADMPPEYLAAYVEGQHEALEENRA